MPRITNVTEIDQVLQTSFVDSYHFTLSMQNTLSYFFQKINNYSVFPSYFFADLQPECQTIWIPDETLHFVGLHLDQNGLQRWSTVFLIHCQQAKRVIQKESSLHMLWIRKSKNGICMLHTSYRL